MYNTDVHVLINL